MIKIKISILFLFVASHLFAQHEIWGTVSNGGQYGYGYIFKTDSVGENLTAVHHFDSTNGQSPGAIIQASNGKLYGLTEKGGQGQLTSNHKGGVLYEYDPSIDSFQVLVHFSQNNTAFPFDGPKHLHGLTEISSGILYGSVAFGGIQNGYVFSYNLLTNTLSNVVAIPTFNGGAMNTTQGNRLNGSLFLASDGFLYSTTERYSQCPIPQPNQGAIIRINPANNSFAYSYINPCSGVNGYYYYSNFIEEGSSLYSVAPLGGATNKGVIYQFTPSTNTYTKKHDFVGGALGESPSPMVKASNGKFYGVAFGGISETNLPQGGGILYEFDPLIDVFTLKANFLYGSGWIGNVGPFPFHLISSQNSKLYGVTGNGVFEYDTQTNSTQAAGRFYPIEGSSQIQTARLVEICKFPTYTFRTNTNFTICSGSDFEYDLESNNSTTVVWKHNGLIDPLQTSTILSITDLDVSDTGTWTAELTNECGTTITQSIQINLAPEVVVTQHNNSLEVISGGDSFQWIDCNTQMIIDLETNNIFFPTQSGSFAVEVTNGNCTDISECTTITVLSIEKVEADIHITLYPNPAPDSIYLTGSSDIQSVTIYNVFGQMVLNREGKNYIDISSLAQDIYFIYVQTDIGIWKSKFVKK